jgi:N4-gp56 family major capsid protein
MAQTTTADLIIPDVWADAVGPTILGRAVMVGLADVDDQLAGQPGETVIFPKFDYIGDADDLTEGVAMGTTALTMSDSRATIKEAGKALELTDSATLSALGNPNSQAQIQLGLAVARKIDKDLRAAAEYTSAAIGIPSDSDYQAATAPLDIATVGPLSWNVLTQATALWGDEYDPAEVAGLVIHSAQHQQLLNDANFLSADKFGEGAVIQRGQIGRIGQMPVFVSDRATVIVDNDGVTAGNQPGVKALLIRKGALALKYKRRPIVETDRDILKRTNVITTNVHYATKRIDDRGVVVISTSSDLVTA